MYELTTVNNLIHHRMQPGFWSVQLDAKSAEILLQFNTGNRRVRKTLVRYLREQVLSGEWQGSHPQPGVFSDSGRLIDGQHRLTAIKESGINGGDSVSMRFETGAKDGVREYMDTGVSRTLEDRVQCSPDHHINKLAAQICNVHFEIIYKIGGRRPTPEEFREFYANHEDAIYSVARIKRNERGAGQMPVAFAAMEYFELQPEMAEQFYSDLFEPDGVLNQSRMLRDWLLRNCYATGAFKRVGRADVYRSAVGCMKAHMEGREVKRVRQSKWD